MTSRVIILDSRTSEHGLFHALQSPARPLARSFCQQSFRLPLNYLARMMWEDAEDTWHTWCEHFREVLGVVHLLGVCINIFQTATTNSEKIQNPSDTLQYIPHEIFAWKIYPLTWNTCIFLEGCDSSIWLVNKKRLLLSIVLWVRTGPSGCNLSNLFQNTDKAVITVLERAFISAKWHKSCCIKFLLWNDLALD